MAVKEFLTLDMMVGIRDIPYTAVSNIIPDKTNACHVGYKKQRDKQSDCGGADKAIPFAVESQEAKIGRSTRSKPNRIR